MQILEIQHLCLQNEVTPACCHTSKSTSHNSQSLSYLIYKQTHGPLIAQASVGNFQVVSNSLLQSPVQRPTLGRSPSFDILEFGGIAEASAC